LRPPVGEPDILDMVETPHVLTVLVVEDEPTLRAAFERFLRDAGYDGQFAADGGAGLALALSARFDLIYLNLELPGLHGIEVLRELRRQGSASAVIVISGHASLAARLSAFNAGADDFIGKPFAWEELDARSRALVRRTTAQGDVIVNAGDLQVNETRRTVTRAGQPIALTRIEYRLLEYLVRMVGRPVTTRLVAHHVWGQEFFESSRTYANTIGTLRHKIQGPGIGPPLLHTLPGGRGYVLDPDFTEDTSSP
jgi:two-component system, OmpR family, response regulator MprA